MKKCVPFILILSVVLLIPLNSHAIKKLGQTGCGFLDIGVGARPAGMGEAFTAIENDVNAIYYNQAGLAKVESKIGITISITDWVGDIKYNAAGLVINGGIWGNLGVSVLSPDYGTIAGTEIASGGKGFTETGQIDASAHAIGLSYARSLTDKFSLGVQIKHIAQHLGSNRSEADGELHENKVSGFAYDFGTLFYPGFESFCFGVSIKNFAPEFIYEENAFELPLTYRIGVAMDILDLFGEHSERSFLIDIDFIHPRDYTERINVGGEYCYNDMLSVRAGYKFNYDGAGLSVGVGFNKGGVKFDYAYSDFGRIVAVNRISVGMEF